MNKLNEMKMVCMKMKDEVRKASNYALELRNIYERYFSLLTRFIIID